MPTPISIPQWISPMYPGIVGQDHLGLGSVSSDQILPALSPGINVLTYHPRYCSFYSFLLYEYWQRELPRSNRTWVRFFRPRDFIYSLGAHLEGHLNDCPQHLGTGNIVGARKTSALASEERPHYHTDENYINSPLGGYGLYYRSIMIDMGLVVPGGPGFPIPVDAPSPQGEALALAFREAIQDTEYFRQYFRNDVADIPREVIQAYINQACLCQLNQDAPDLEILRQTYLTGGEGLRAKARRETFRMLLDLAEQTSGKDIYQEAFRQLLYFQATPAGSRYTPRESVLDTYKRWRLYQAREYFNFALNALWVYLCDWGIEQWGDIHPVSLHRWWEHLEAVITISPIAAQVNIADPRLTSGSTWKELVDWLEGNGCGSLSTLEQPLSLTDLNEHYLYEHIGRVRPTDGAGEIPMAALTLLALLYLRLRNPSLWQDPAWETATMGRNGRLPMDEFVQHLHDCYARGSTLIQVLKWTYDDAIIFQHLLVATRKLPENTFRFQKEGSTLRFSLFDNPLDFRDSRYGALSTTLYELGLCGNLWDEEHPLTPAGHRFLEEGEL